MKTNDFIKVVNLLIDKKLKELIPKMVEIEVKKQLESGIQPDASDFYNDDDLKNLIPHGDYKNSIIRDGSIKAPTAEGKNWSKNSAINKILNETAESFVPLKKDPADTLAGGNYQQMMADEYGDMGNFNTKNMSGVVNRNPVSPGKPAVNNLKNELLQEPGAAPEIVDAMVKDYSGVMKSLAKSAKTKRGGGGMPLMPPGVGESW